MNQHGEVIDILDDDGSVDHGTPINETLVRDPASDLEAVADL